MASASDSRRITPALGALLLVALAGCRTVDAKVSNLRSLHEPDGTIRKVAVIQSDFQFLLRKFMNTLNFRGQGFGEPEPEAVDDPLGTSLENLIELGESSSEDDRVLGLQAEIFSWLAVDCEYQLSRERAVLELAEVGRRLAITDPIKPPEEEQATQPEQAVEWLRALRAAIDPYLAVNPPGPRSASAVADAVGAIDFTQLDRDGARRLLGATNVWYDAKGYEQPELSALGELRRELARRSVELALAQALSDPEPRVRVAALKTCVALTKNRSPRLLRAALTDSEPEVVACALRLLSQHGVPPEPEPDFEGDLEAYREAWIGLVVRVLRTVGDGQVAVAGCRALERITDAGLKNLRPEVWIAWYEAREPQAQG